MAEAAVDASALAAALDAAGAALDAAAALDEDSLDVLLPPQAASASEATPSTAADLRTVVRFMQSPYEKKTNDGGYRRVGDTLRDGELRAGNPVLHRWCFVILL
jgi:hypothetical protein